MERVMKRILWLLLSFYAFSGFAFEHKFDTNFKIVSSQFSNRSVSALSILDDQVAFVCGNKIYVGSVGDQYDVTSVEEKTDLSRLGIEGQFAQSGNNTIYYSSNGRLYSAVLKNGEWVSQGELKIDGYVSERVMGKGSSFAHRRWGFKAESKTKEHMYNPTIGNKGRRLYFSSSELSGGKGGTDIWYMDRNSDDVSWSAPVNYSDVNTEDDEDFPRIFGDTIFYFSSNRKDKLSGYNIYKKRLRGNKAMSLLVGDFNSNGDDRNYIIVRNVPFFLTNRNGSDLVYRPEYYDEDLIWDKEVNSVVSPDAKSSKHKLVNIFGQKCTFYPVFNNKVLSESYEDEFNEIFDFINETPNAKIEIICYTDDEGDEDHNYSLSLYRASAVMDRLVEMGVNEDRMTYVGEGNKSPIIKDAKSESERRKNRRIVIIKK